MANCRPCLIKGRRVEGGSIGLCRNCQKKKCRNFTICGRLSAGRDYCQECEFEVVLAHLRARALNPLEFQAALEGVDVRVRQELAWEGKRFMHEAVECFSRALVQIISALYGGQPSQRDDTSDTDRMAA